jgi:hypothetical protein
VRSHPGVGNNEGIKLGQDLMLNMAKRVKKEYKLNLITVKKHVE